MDMTYTPGHIQAAESDLGFLGRMSKTASGVNTTVINVHVSDSVVGNERLLADTVRRAIKNTDVRLGQRSAVIL